VAILPPNPLLKLGFGTLPMQRESLSGRKKILTSPHKSVKSRHFCSPLATGATYVSRQFTANGRNLGMEWNGPRSKVDSPASWWRGPFTSSSRPPRRFAGFWLPRP